MAAPLFFVGATGGGSVFNFAEGVGDGGSGFTTVGAGEGASGVAEAVAENSPDVVLASSTSRASWIFLSSPAQSNGDSSP